PSGFPGRGGLFRRACGRLETASGARCIRAGCARRRRGSGRRRSVRGWTEIEYRGSCGYNSGEPIRGPQGEESTMKTPFLGMDPYLEHPTLWESVHARLIHCMANQLQPLLVPHYVASVEERVYVEET